MRALALLVLSVMVLAMLQASYLVAEAKNHNVVHNTDVAAKKHEEKHWKMKENKNKGHKHEHEHEKEVSDDKDKKEKVTDMAVADMMQGDQPPQSGNDGPATSDRSGRRERVSKEDRRANRQGRKQRKEERQQRKEEKQQKKNERQSQRRDKQAKKAERKANREKNPRKERTRVTCSADTDCQTGECCIPNHSGTMTCKNNRRPRGQNKKCLTSCVCTGDLKCYLPNDQEASGSRNFGKCIVESDADLIVGKFIEATTYQNN